MQRINKLKLKNFKFFLEEETIDFDNKNLLLFGENGSGKSSIYWALYTFFQSIYKIDVDEIKKYFDKTKLENLLNIFSDDTDKGHIIVEYIASDKTLTTKEISFATQNTLSDNLVKEASQSSDFINYRLLSRIYDFSVRTPIDLFSIFEDEVLSFVTFGVEFATGKNNGRDWWDFIKVGQAPATNMKTTAYRDFQHKVGLFNNALNSYIQELMQSANEHLKNNFKQPLILKLQYHNATYNDFQTGSTTKRIKVTKSPKIILTVDFEHIKLTPGSVELTRPQTFLNEARLTAIALSIRLAILDQKFIEQSPKLLVLDDLLISLDMSNRDLVLDLILEKYVKYQLLILTHDKAFFYLIKRRIEVSKNKKNWIVKEMFQQISLSGIPGPFIPNSNDYLDQAKKYFLEFDYPAAANYLRKETEKILRNLLPTNKTISITKDDGVKELQLDGLIDNFKKNYESAGGDFSPLIKLKEYKDILLNPLSHDNIDTPIYKLELESVFKIIDLLKKLDAKIIASATSDPLIYLEEVDDAGTTWRYTIELLENYRALKLLDGIWRTNNPRCLFKRRENLRDNSVINLNVDVNLVKGYDQVRYALNIKNTPPTKSLEELIKNSQNVYITTLLL